MKSIILSESQLKKLPVFGIAGNFAGHLQQAGEAADFTELDTTDTHNNSKNLNVPKGIFPIYIPGYTGQIGAYPLCHHQIIADFSQPLNLQAEPELCLHLKVDYNDQKQIQQLNPIAFNVFNDCSIRRPNAQKISEKKNWGHCSKGIGQQWLPCTTFKANGTLSHYRIASFLYRNQTYHPYGEDSPVESYSYFYQKLIQWMIHTFNTQKDQGPLENLSHLIQAANYPQEIIVTLGATRYSKFGEQHFLEPNDTLFILLYPASRPFLQSPFNLTQLPNPHLILKQTILPK